MKNRVSKKGYNLLVATSANNPNEEGEHIIESLDMGMHGLLIRLTTTLFHPSDTIHEIHHKKYPYTIVSYVEDTVINYISTDQCHGVY